MIVTSLKDTRTGHWLAELAREPSAAQAEVFRLLVVILKERV